MTNGRPRPCGTAPDPGPGPNRNECRVLRRLRRRPQRHPGGGIPGRRVQLPADPGPRRRRLRGFDGGGVPGRGRRDRRRQPAELGRRPSSAWPSGSRSGEGRAWPPGHRVSGRDHLLRASTYYRTAEYYADGESGTTRCGMGERSQACFAEGASLLDPPVELIEVPFERGRSPATWSARPAATPGPERAASPPWSGWAGSTRAPRSSTSTWVRPGPSGAGTCSSSTARASPDACAPTRP